MSVPTPADALDSKALAMIRRIGGEDLLSKMIGLFLDRAPGQLHAARAALETGDLRALAQAVHGLKSSAGQLGASRVANLAQQIETHCDAGHATPLPSLFAELEAANSTASALLALQRGAPNP